MAANVHLFEIFRTKKVVTWVRNNNRNSAAKLSKKHSIILCPGMNLTKTK